VAELMQALGVWITEVVPAPQIVQQFPSPTSTADREVLAVTTEKAVDHILTDDGPLAREALRYGLVCLRLPQVVVLMKQQGLVPEVRPVLDRIRQHGYGIAAPFYSGALAAAGE
jgi:predicted nucleic acid-binding protein